MLLWSNTSQAWPHAAAVMQFLFSGIFSVSLRGSWATDAPTSYITVWTCRTAYLLVFSDFMEKSCQLSGQSLDNSDSDGGIFTFRLFLVWRVGSVRTCDCICSKSLCVVVMYDGCQCQHTRTFIGRCSCRILVWMTIKETATGVLTVRFGLPWVSSLTPTLLSLIRTPL